MKALFFRAFFYFYLRAMFKKYWPFIGLAAVGAYLYFKGFKRTLENLRVTLFGIKLDMKRTTQAAFSKIYLNVTLRIENPNTQAVKINEIGLNLLRNGKQLASGKQLDSFTLQAKNTTNVPILLSFRTDQVFKLVQDFIKLVMAKEQFMLSVKGYVNAEGNMINFEHEQPVQW